MTVLSVAIGIDVGGTTTKGAVVSPTDGRILERVEIPTAPQAATKSTIEVVESLVARADDLGVVPVAVGVGAAGFVDTQRGAVTFSPNTVYDDPDVADAVAARVNLPVMVDNDANAAAWGERTFGKAAGCNHLALITLGTGVGSGFVVNGRVLRGYSGAGAELGHMVIDPSGPRCNCGLRGCLEQFASGQAIARMGRDALVQDPDSSIAAFADGQEVTGEHVARAAREMDEAARDVLRQAGRALGIGLSNVANLFDPEVIVLAGGVIGAGEPYLGSARDELVRRTEAQRRRPMRLDLSSLGADAGLLGAASLAIDELSRGGADRDPGRQEG